MAQQWYSIVEYARAFSISDMTVRRRIKTGKLNAVLKDGKYFIPVDANETGSVSSPVNSPVNSPVMRDSVRSGNHLAGQRSNDAHLPYVSQSTPRYESRNAQVTSRPEAGEGFRPRVASHNIPASVTRPFERADALVMKADQLISYCDRMLNELRQSKAQNRELYESKIKTLEATLAAKDVELQQFRQQVEDLQVLVKILENKKVN